MPARELMLEYLDFVDDVLDELDTREEWNTSETMLERGSGAERQLQVFEETGDLKKVVAYMVEETQGGALDQGSGRGSDRDRGSGSRSAS